MAGRHRHRRGRRRRTRFQRLEASLARRPGVRSPKGLAASIGRGNYGARRYAAMAAAGRRRAAWRRRAAP